MRRRALFGSGGTGGLLVLAIAASCTSEDAGGVPTLRTGTSSGTSGGTSGGTSSGAPPGDAGPGDSGSGVDAGDPCAGSFFCDDFEAYAAGAAPGKPWAVTESGGKVAVDGAHVHSGKNAVKLAANAAGGYRSVMLNLANASFLPPTPNHLFGRMRFWLDSSPTTDVHWTFIDALGKTPGGYHALYRYGGQTPAAAGNTLMANYDTPDSYDSPPVGPGSDCWLHSATVVPVARWACAEWEFDGPNDTMRFWLDGQPIADLTMSGTGQGCVNQPDTFRWTAPTFERVDLGWESYQADDARTLWIDDVALGKARLGCSP